MSPVGEAPFPTKPIGIGTLPQPQFGRDKSSILGVGAAVQGVRLLGKAGHAAAMLIAALCIALTASAEEAAPPPPLRIVVFGDSQAQGISGGLQRVLLDDPRYKVLNRTHPGAALVHHRGEWLGPIERFVGKETADIAIVMFGANDRLDFRDPDQGGVYLHFRSDPWHTAYARRIDEILTLLTGAHLKIIWCGNPIARSPTYSADMEYINGIYQEEVARFGGSFFPLWQVIVDDKGNFAAYGKDRNGENRRLRGDDGIHFTAAGYELIAEKLVAALPPTPANAP